MSLDDNPCLPANWRPDCFAAHLGDWMIEAGWFARSVAAVKAGLFVPAPPGEGENAYSRTSDGVAVLSLEGPLAKGRSKFGGTSTVAARQAVRQAARDESVRAILLLVDSPGGTVAGTAELAADIATAGRSKPVHAHVEDLAASAAYWLASQAQRVTATPMSQIGSIGTYCVLEDSSGAKEKEGIRVHVVAAGRYKGLGEEGRPISQDELEYVQDRINALNEHFLAGVAAGRRMPLDRVRAVADGRIYLAEEAVALGLIDAVADHDTAMAAVRAAADKAKGIIHMWNPVKTVGSVSAPAADGVSAAPAVAQAVAEQPEQPPAEAAAAAPAVPRREEVAAEEPAIDRRTVESEVRADLKRFTEAFGPQGAVWFAEGVTFGEAQARHAAAIQADRDRLAAENAELKARVAADRGSPEPVSFSPAAEGRSPAAVLEQRLEQKVGRNIARAAAGLTFKK